MLVKTKHDKQPDDFQLVAQNMQTYEACGYTGQGGYEEAEDIPVGYEQRVLPPQYGLYLNLEQIEDGRKRMQEDSGAGEVIQELEATLEKQEAYTEQLYIAGASAAIQSMAEPTATVGFFIDAIEPWKAGTTYAKQNSLFSYNGKVGFTRQANITAQAHQPPFSTGMESVYGVRPAPDEGGVFPYTYNMAASVDMRVREGTTIYKCTKKIDLMLNPPSQLAGFFVKE